VSAEPTVQQDDTPQPPPLKPAGGEEGEKPLPEQQLKDDIFLLTLFDPHCGQALSFSVHPTFCRSEKLSLQASQTYS
jgi:hypothetical protein